MPDCQRTFASLPQPHVGPNGHADFSIGIAQFIDGGRAVVQRQEIGTGASTWYLLDVNVGTMLPLPAAPGASSLPPFLSLDGLATGWVVPIAGSGPPVLDTVLVRPATAEARDRIIDLSPFGAASYELVGLETPPGAVLLWKGIDGRLLSVGPDGKEQPAPRIPAGVDPQSSTIVLSRHGTLAWDAYKEDGNYTVAWSMDAGSGLRRIPRGSSIVAAAAHASGRYVAVSTSTTLSIGEVRDAVFIINAADGREVFRRFLPKYSRTNVVFLGSEYFAYSDANTVHVVRIPRV